ncbi:hypothetical protein ILUMI_14005, partial [Ignelater luminosus]
MDSNELREPKQKRRKGVKSVTFNNKGEGFHTQNEQDTYLQNLITPKAVVWRRAVEGESVKKKPPSSSYKCSVLCSSGRKEVCKEAFATLHGITDNRIRRVCNLLLMGKYPKDLREKRTPAIAKSVSESVDYMQNLMLPCIPIQDTFYLQQLSVNVFNIHDMKTEKSFIYAVGKKGPNEVYSFIVDFIMKEIISEEVKHLHIFMDGCPGQNKNHTTVRMCSAVVQLEKFETVDQNLPIRGHSYMPRA